MEATETVSAPAKTAGERLEGGKFLTFQLLNEEYGLEILTVREIIGIMDITTVPKTPAYVKGVINLRGQVIPVIDLRLKFGMPEGEYGKRTCIVVVNVNGLQMGIVVDTVSEVMDIDAENIEAAPSFGTQINTDYILGMGKVQGAVKILLDIGEVLTSEEMVMMEEIAKVAPIAGEGKKGKKKDEE
ncbi:MAG: chemotaxis protein CheW [Deltaproteobacteria bacterium]|nr:chemotaxis protein CheW [Deltaproteobacteria bacterium]